MSETIQSADALLEPQETETADIQPKEAKGEMEDEGAEPSEAPQEPEGDPGEVTESKPKAKSRAPKRKKAGKAQAKADAAEAELSSDESEPGSDEPEPGSDESEPGPDEPETESPAVAVVQGEASEAGAKDPADAPSAEEEEDTKVGPGEALSDEELVAAVSALIFASPEPLGTGRLRRLLEGPRRPRVVAALEVIEKRLAKSKLPLELREIAGGWRLMTSPAAQETVARLVKARKADKLSPAGLETLAVIAYRQPVTKAEIEAIRGVQCGAMLRNLVDRGLARVTGRADVPGAPLQYGTSKEFLDRFGMGSLKDLPRDGELLKE